MKYIALSIVSIIVTLSSCSFSNSEITSTEIKTHISFLASDSLINRESGSHEEMVVAEYIANEFEKIGLLKFNDSFFQKYTAVAKITEGENNYMHAGSVVTNINVDYKPLAITKNTEIKAEVVFAGYGIKFKRDSLNWNDYDSIDVKNKWVMMLKQNPDTNNTSNHSIPYSNERAKILLASSKGAAGVLFVSGSKTEKKDILLDHNLDKIGTRANIPVVQITRLLANKLLVASGSNVDSLEMNMITQMKPISLNTKLTLDVKTDINIKTVETQNIISKIEGSDPKLKDEIVLICAHYNYLDLYRHKLDSPIHDSTYISNIPIDNASGIASLLEIANKMANDKIKPKRTVVFAAFGGEGMKLLESDKVIEKQLIDKIKVVLNFDMIGALDNNETLTINSNVATPLNDRLISKYKSNENLNVRVVKGELVNFGHSDFHNNNIPSLYLTTEPINKNNPNLINFERTKDAVEVGYEIAKDFINAETIPEFKKNKTIIPELN